MKNLFNLRRKKNKEKTLNEIEERLDKIEQIIAEKGYAGVYLRWTTQIKRDLKIVLVAGAVGLATGVSLCAWLRLKD